MADRIHNFNPGPAALPLAVLEQTRDAMEDFAGSGMSIAEISHRAPVFEEVINQSVDRIRRLLNLGTEFKILFLQGGASMQFCMVPMNLIPPGGSADYINTGTRATKAIKETQLLGKPYKVIASSEDRNLC